MPRMKRLDLPGVAQHVVQRGNDRQACFFQDMDYVRYLQDLREASLRYGCSVHAYVLMTNHVHLLVTPAEAGSLGRMMQAVGRRYVRYINDSARHTGTLWEGRYKASLVDNERYVLACYRYIELNPVRAAMVVAPTDYPWSSYRGNGLGIADALLTQHASYRALGADAVSRGNRYREIVAEAIPPDELAAIRLYVQRQRALGSDRFQQQIEALLGRRAAIGNPGRPSKSKLAL